jgi:hypothetical protein
VKAHRFDTWVDLTKDKKGNVEWSERTASVWKTVYSSEGYLRVEGLSLLKPGETHNLQVEFQPLPPEECHEIH